MNYKNIKILAIIFTVIFLLSLNSASIDVVYASSDLELETREEKREENRNIDAFEEGLDPVRDNTRRHNEETAEAIGDLFRTAAPDAGSIEEANYRVRPIAEIINTITAMILGITIILLGLVTTVDLLYIAVPITRDYLDGGGQGGNLSNTQPQGMGRPGMGRSSYGMGRSSYGMGGSQVQNQQNHGGGLSAIGRVVSDEAIGAIQEVEASKQMAMSGQGRVKTTITLYMKKRAFFLIMFGVCVVMFTTTVFTDLGVRIGMWFMRIIMGIG